ncbi:hypothetical protein R5W24_000465 [Gemmata sp. JC717]|uniref:hypothetical protein n=1 Tax=Gemmata algarum TaxID=2975278 RepID=UPI0021BA526A|nr:hypothetical protein [Gemmata algarum]MDY3551389.1 hypothetical protein [Gemmata algarum]
MPLNPTIFNVKDGTATDKSMIAYTDGSKNTFGHALLDSDGALMNPASAGKQDTGNASLATIATNTTGLATATNQGTANTSLAAIATNTTGVATAANQSTGNASLATIATNTGTAATGIGAPADAAASSDTGTFGLIAFVKRSMQNWTSLLARVPALASGRVPVDGSGVTQPVSAVSLPLPTGAATSSNQTTSNTSLASIDGKLPVLDNAKVSVVPSMTSGGNTFAQTAATGTNWTAFPSRALKQLTVSNQTGVTLEFQQDGAGVGLQIPTTGIYTFYGITNANQIGVRRVDTANTQVTVTARWEA